MNIGERKRKVRGKSKGRRFEHSEWTVHLWYGARAVTHLSIIRQIRALTLAWLWSQCHYGWQKRDESREMVKTRTGSTSVKLTAWL